MSELDCRALRDALRGGGLDPSAARAHLAACPPCAALLADDGRVARALDAGGPTAGAPDVGALLAGLERAVERDRGSLLQRARAWPTPLRRALVLASALPVSLYTLAHHGLRADPYPAWRTVALVLAFGALLLRNAWVAMRPPHEPLEPTGRACLFAALALLAAAAAAGAPPPYPMADALCWDTSWGMVRTCFLWGLAIGAPILVTTLLLGRLSTPRALVLAGSAAGLAGNLSLHLDCPNVERWHLLAGHATQVAAFVLLALALSRVAGRNREAPPA